MKITLWGSNNGYGPKLYTAYIHIPGTRNMEATSFTGTDPERIAAKIAAWAKEPVEIAGVIR